MIQNQRRQLPAVDQSRAAGRKAGMYQMENIKLGFVPAHREPFDDDWAVNMRKRCLGAMSRVKGLKIIAPDGKLIIADLSFADKQEMNRYAFLLIE